MSCSGKDLKVPLVQTSQFTLHLHITYMHLQYIFPDTSVSLKTTMIILLGSKKIFDMKCIEIT